MKKIIITLITALTTCVISAQEHFKYNQETHAWDKQEIEVDNSKLKSLFNKSEITFEGFVVGYKELKDTTFVDGGFSYEIFDVVLIKVTKVLSGDIKEGVISMIETEPKQVVSKVNGEISITETFSGNIITLPELPKSGIYFCKQRAKMPSDNDFPKYILGNDNSLMTTKTNIFANLNSLELYLSERHKIKFSSKNEIYNFLKKYEFFSVPETNEQDNEQEKKDLDSTPKKKMLRVL